MVRAHLARQLELPYILKMQSLIQRSQYKHLYTYSTSAATAFVRQMYMLLVNLTNILSCLSKFIKSII